MGWFLAFLCINGGIPLHFFGMNELIFQMNELIEGRIEPWEGVTASMLEKWRKIVGGLSQHARKSGDIASGKELEDERLRKVVEYEALRTKVIKLQALGSFPKDEAFVKRLFVSETSLYPAILENGAYKLWGVFFIVGLFLNRILRCIKDDGVDFHVFCQGWNFNESDDVNISNDWWTIDVSNQDGIIPGNESISEEYGKRIIEAVFDSIAFKVLKPLEAIAKDKRHRVVVWLAKHGHAFAIGWDMYKEGGKQVCDVFCFDSIRLDDFVISLIRKFHCKLSEKYRDFECRDNISSQIREDDIGIRDDFPCVPFMARCTLYCSLMNNIKKDCYYVEFMASALPNGIETDRQLYLYYERILWDFVTETIKMGNKVVLAPEIFVTQKIMNIEDICIEKFDIETGETQKYVFCGFGQKFVELKLSSDVSSGGGLTQHSEETPACCPIQAHLHYHPAASPLHAIRFCKQLVWDILDKGNTQTLNKQLIPAVTDPYCVFERN